MTVLEAIYLKTGDRVQWNRGDFLDDGQVLSVCADQIIIVWDISGRTYHPLRGSSQTWEFIERERPTDES